MKIQILSDIHLEFSDYSYDFSQADVVILAGDIHVGSQALPWIQKNIPDKPVLYVLGNHEYYRNVFPSLQEKIKNELKGSNIHLLENDSITFGNVQFLGATLWTDFNLFENAEAAAQLSRPMLSDFRLIKKSPEYCKIRPEHMVKAHKESLHWLNRELQKNSKYKKVVISHHAPSMLSVEAKYKRDVLTAAFASNLDDFIQQHHIDLWFHGHVHSCHDYTLKNTRIVCNPQGYPGETDSNFNPQKIVEI